MISGNTSPYQYWESKLIFPKLRIIALKIFNLLATSNCVERNFNLFGFIHSKKRNSLSNEKIEKLVYIKHNYNLVNTLTLDINSIKSKYWISKTNDSIYKLKLYNLSICEKIYI